MKPKILIVGAINKLFVDITKYDFVIGVDQGAGYLLAHNEKLDLAIGDFDSMTENEKQLLEQQKTPVITYPTIKDETDGELAMIYVQQHFAQYECDYIINKHDYAFIWTLLHLMIKYHVNIISEESYSKCYYPQKKSYLLTPKPTFRYISFIALNPTIISVTNMKYPVSNFKSSDLCLRALRNEFLTTEADLTVQKNPVIAIWSK